MDKLTIYFVRHGRPNYPIDELTDIGRIEAKKTSEYLANVPFDIIFSSNLIRAKDTAKYLADKQNKKIIELPWASEENSAYFFAEYDEKIGKKNFIFWIDKYCQKLIELEDDENWYKDPFFKSIKAEEGVKFYNKNVDEWLLSLGIIHDRKTKTFHKKSSKTPEYVILFAHGAMAMAFFSNILDQPYSYVSTHFRCLDTCGIARVAISFETGKAVLEKYNEKI